MDFGNTYMSEELNVTDTDMEQETEDSKKRSQKVDRSSNKYSEEDFRALSRDEQLRLANIHWMDSKGYDESKMFQFSYTHFSNICKELGFVKGVIDTREGEAPDPEVALSSIVYIEHGKREETEVKKLTLDKGTISKIDQLLGDKLSNVEKSKVIDAILSQALDKKLADKRVGQFGVAYRPLAEERLL